MLILAEGWAFWLVVTVRFAIGLIKGYRHRHSPKPPRKESTFPWHDEERED